MAGLTATGFDIPTLQEIITDIETEEQLQIDTDLNVSTDSVVGQINGIVAAKILQVWELAQQVYSAAYPDSATGQALANVATITGTVKRAATKATLSVLLNGTASTVIPIGTAVTVVGDPDSRFETTVLKTIEGGGSIDAILEATNPGSSSKAFLATDTLTIATPVTGLDTVTIVADYTPGLDAESDPDLRVRRDDELAAPGTGTLDAMRADLLAIVDTAGDSVVTSCSVLENVTYAPVDANGLPIWEIEVVIGGTATDQQIADQILASKPAGTGTFGTELGTAADDAGNVHNMYWSIPIEKDVYIDITLVTNADTYVGDAVVKETVVDLGNTLQLGEDVIRQALMAAVMELEGVIDITTFELGFSASPSGTTNLTVGTREVAIFDSADITIPAP